ncbi:MAG: phytanoyl-CoA dioxygenase family protein [Planctomycetes bacterium]|nr:phytanoyl-CoA dioxygenase family protein [Planctomycetota bacterium]
MDPVSSPLPLSASDIEQFVSDGYVRVRHAFPVEDALAMQDHLWSKLALKGVHRDDRSTWDREFSGLGSGVNHPICASIGSERLHRACDQLFGTGRWMPPTGWGGLRVTFPRSEHPWHMTDHAWHCDHWPSEKRGHALFPFTFLSDIRPRGGGTLLVAGAHRVIARYVAGLDERRRRWKNGQKSQDFGTFLPWLAELTGVAPARPNRIERFMEHEHVTDHGERLRVVEATGKPGDVMLCHASVFHAASMNCGDWPRFMRFGLIEGRSPPENDSPLGRSMIPLALTG